MRTLSSALVLLAALVNLAPVIGVVSGDRLQSLYGIAFQDPSLLILMRHRAVLFGIVGGLLLASAVRVSLRPLARIAGFVSMLSFVFIAWLVGDYNAELERVVVIDLVALLALLGSTLIDHFTRRGEGPA
jgi:hypothetical protein